MNTTERLVVLYKETGLKKVDFAKLLGKSDSYVCDLLKGSRNLSEQKLFKITAVLKMKEIKIGSKVKLITKEYKKTENYNPRDMQGEATNEEKLKLLVEEWRKRQLHYEKVAQGNTTSEHNNRKFTYKAMATRDCWKELLELIKDEK